MLNGGEQYGANGFYFQQKRGKLDLKSVSRLDLDRIVRDVDVEALQNHLENLTYGCFNENDLRFCTDEHVIKLFKLAQMIIEYLLYAQEQLMNSLNSLAGKYTDKKRSLAKKKQELAEYQASTKQMKAQLKIKKKGLTAMEDHLKEAGHLRAKEKNVPSRSTTSDVLEDDSGDVNMDKEPPTVRSKISYYVTGPDGLCIEFESKGSMFIADVCDDVRAALVSRMKNNIGSFRNMTLSLIYRGKILLENSSLNSNRIRHGDTIVAVVNNPKNYDGDDEDDNVLCRDKENSRSKVDGISNLMEMFLKKQESISNEIKNGWQNAVKTMTQQSTSTASDAAVEESHLGRDLEALSKMEDTRWNKIESMMQQQLDAQMAFYEQQRLQLAVTNKKHEEPTKRIVASELLSDTEDAMLFSREEVGDKLRSSNSKISHLEHQVYDTEAEIRQLKELLSKQSQDMGDLKRKLVSKPPSVVTPAVPVSAPAVQRATPTPATVAVPSKKIAPEPVTPKELKPVAVIVPVEKEIIAIVPVDAPAPIVAAPIVAAPIVAAPEQAAVVAADDDIVISFHPMMNEDLQLYHYTSPMKCKVLKDVTFNDMIFEIRSAVASELEVPLARVVLNLNGKKIVLGLDSDIVCSAVEAAEFAFQGLLTIHILSVNPISDAQLDVVVEKWENRDVFSDPNRKNKARAVKKTSPSSVKEDKPEQPWEIFQKKNDTDRHIDVARESLDSAIQDISDKEGLTDEELEQKMAMLTSSMDSLPQDMTKHIKSYRESVASHVGAAVDRDDVDDQYDDLEENESFVMSTGGGALGVADDSYHQSRSTRAKSNLQLSSSFSHIPRGKSSHARSNGGGYTGTSSARRLAEEDDSTVLVQSREYAGGSDDEDCKDVQLPYLLTSSFPPSSDTSLLAPTDAAAGTAPGSAVPHKMAGNSVTAVDESHDNQTETGEQESTFDSTIDITNSFKSSAAAYRQQQSNSVAGSIGSSNNKSRYSSDDNDDSNVMMINAPSNASLDGFESSLSTNAELKNGVGGRDRTRGRGGMDDSDVTDSHYLQGTSQSGISMNDSADYSVADIRTIESQSVAAANESKNLNTSNDTWGDGDSGVVSFDHKVDGQEDSDASFHLHGSRMTKPSDRGAASASFDQQESVVREFDGTTSTLESNLTNISELSGDYDDESTRGEMPPTAANVKAAADRREQQAEQRSGGPGLSLGSYSRSQTPTQQIHNISASSPFDGLQSNHLHHHGSLTYDGYPGANSSYDMEGGGSLAFSEDSSFVDGLDESMGSVSAGRR